MQALTKAGARPAQPLAGTRTYGPSRSAAGPWREATASPVPAARSRSLEDAACLALELCSDTPAPGSSEHGLAGGGGCWCS